MLAMIRAEIQNLVDPVEAFLTRTGSDLLVTQLRKERKAHQRRIIELRGMHDPKRHEWVADTLDEIYSNINRIDDILDHKYRYRNPITGLDTQVEWWNRK